MTEAWNEWGSARSTAESPYGAFYKLVRNWVVEGRVLELGCSTGMNITKLSEIGEYHGIDLSPTSVDIARRNHPEHATRIVQGDFSDELPFVEGGFDAVVERASIPHNRKETIWHTLENVYNALKPGGIFVSYDWFSMSHSEAHRGRPVEMGLWGRTMTDYDDGQFRDIGLVHFSTYEELRELFQRFQGLFIQERSTVRKAPGFAAEVPHFPWESIEYRFAEYRSALWDIVVRKPK